MGVGNCFQKVTSWLKDTTFNLRSAVDAYKDINPETPEGKAIAQMTDTVGELENAYAQALANASGRYQEVGIQDREDTAPIYSLREFDDGIRFVDVQADPNLFDGMTVAEMNQYAKKILSSKFTGKVIGIDNRVFVNGDSVNKIIHPSKSIDLETRKAKLAASSELDNLLDAGIALPNEPDGRDGHVHPDAIDFSYYRTIFKVGTEYFEGIVNIKNIKRGKLLKDVTKIKNITEDIVSSYGNNPKSNFLRDASMISIRNSNQNVNSSSNNLEGTPQGRYGSHVPSLLNGIPSETSVPKVGDEFKQKNSLRNQAAESQEFARWASDVQAAKAAYGDIDFGAELQNPEFVRLLRSGVGVKDAYFLSHKEEILMQAMHTAALGAEEKVNRRIAQNRTRPRENGLSSSAAFITKPNISHMTKADRQSIARRAAKGERIVF